MKDDGQPEELAEVASGSSAGAIRCWLRLRTVGNGMAFLSSGLLFITGDAAAGGRDRLRCAFWMFLYFAVALTWARMGSDLSPYWLALPSRTSDEEDAESEAASEP